MTESPSHTRSHPPELQVALLSALLYCRGREITDALVHLLLSTVHRIGARAERRVTTQLVNAFKRVQGKEGLLFRVADASLARPDDPVRTVVFPVVGEVNRLRHPAAGREVRLDVSRLDQRHMHAKGRHLVRKGFAQALQSELARAVESLERDADYAADGADQHDAPAALRPHGGQHLLHHPHAAPEVGLQLGLCLPVVHCSTAPARFHPAAATSASIRPPAASTLATPVRTESSSSTSMTKPAHPPEVVPRLLAPVTAQPAACNSSAQALPMPADAPVTSAHLAPSLMGAPISQPTPTARRTSQPSNRMPGTGRASRTTRLAASQPPGLNRCFFADDTANPYQTSGGALWPGVLLKTRKDL